nr:reverse transcriptase domain-containing protein [Tanacetum cinerariifolium]
MRTRSSSNLVGESSPNLTSSNPKRRNRRRSKQPFILEESPVDTMADQRTMAELLRAPTESYAEEKLLELANTPLNENCSAVILKKLPEKLIDPGKFLILCGFSELKCKALANLGASINLMPLSVWKKLGLPELISTRMTLKLANRAICTPIEIARDVFVPVGKFTFSADFVIVDYESDPRVPLILGRPFLQTARALMDIHGEEMILHDGDERLTLNMRHDTSSYSNQPQKESINMINIFNDSCEDYLEDLFATNHLSGNPTFSSHTDLTSQEVKDDIFDPEGDIVLIEKLLNLDSTKDLPPPHNINLLSGSTTSSSPDHLLEEERENFLNHDPIKEMDSIIEDSVDERNLANPNVNLVDTIPEMFTDKHALDYSSPLLYDEYDDDLFEIESDNDDAYNDPFDSKGENQRRGHPYLGCSVSPFLSPMNNSMRGLGQAKISWILKTRARGFVLRSPDLHILSFILGIQYPNLID